MDDPSNLENTGTQIQVDNTEVLSPTSEPVEVIPSTEAPQSSVRYNPVTGEDMNMDEILNPTSEKLKTVEVQYKPTSKANTFFLVLFFIFMLVFIIYLPDIVVWVDEYKNQKLGNYTNPEDILTGKLVCTLEANTVNLDRKIERVFDYTDKKLTGAKFVTTVMGDATLDEETLDQLNSQCLQIKDNIGGMSGVSVSCEYSHGQLIEKEIFDYSSYDASSVSTAYVEAGGSLVQFEYEEDIDTVMVQMRQSGFTCTKSK